MAPDANALEERLRSLLGLNKYEASAYLALLRLGESRPQDVARESSVPAQRIYDVLRSLQSMGLVAEKDGVYYAIDPSSALPQLAEKEVARALQLAEDIKTLARELTALASSTGRPAPRLLKGVDDVLAAAVSAASSCNRRALFTAYKVFERLTQLRPALLRLVQSLSSGADIVVPPGYAERYRPDVEEISKYGVRVVESPMAMLDIMVACESVIIGLTHEGDVVALSVVDRDFASALEARLRQLAGLQQ